LECPAEEARLTDGNGNITAASLAGNWMFGITYEIAQQCFALGLQIRQLIEQLGQLSVELAGVNLPAKYLDPETGRCCVLLAPSADPLVTRGFNVAVPYQSQWTVQSVLFVTARLLTYEQCLLIRKDGAEARRRLAEQFAADKSFAVSSLPIGEWAVPYANAFGLAAAGAAGAGGMGAINIGAGAAAAAAAAAPHKQSLAMAALSANSANANNTSSSSSSSSSTSSASSSSSSSNASSSNNNSSSSNSSRAVPAPAAGAPLSVLPSASAVAAATPSLV